MGWWSWGLKPHLPGDTALVHSHPPPAPVGPQEQEQWSPSTGREGASHEGRCEWERNGFLMTGCEGTQPGNGNLLALNPPSVDPCPVLLPSLDAASAEGAHNPSGSGTGAYTDILKNDLHRKSPFTADRIHSKFPRSHPLCFLTLSPAFAACLPWVHMRLVGVAGAFLSS